MPLARLASVTNSVVCSMSVPTAEAFHAPLIVLPFPPKCGHDAVVDLARSQTA
jgi:hypothetical protein